MRDRRTAIFWVVLLTLAGGTVHAYDGPSYPLKPDLFVRKDGRPHRMGGQIVRVLQGLGITRLEEAPKKLYRDDILGRRNGLGPKSFGVIKRALRERGLDPIRRRLIAGRPRGRLPELNPKGLRNLVAAPKSVHRDLKILNIYLIEATSFAKLTGQERQERGLASFEDVAAGLEALKSSVLEQNEFRQRGNRMLRAEVLKFIDEGLTRVARERGVVASTKVEAAARRAGSEVDQHFSKWLERAAVNVARRAKFRYDKRSKLHFLFQGNWALETVGEDRTVPVPRKRWQAYKLLWEAYRAVDHILDSEYTYKVELNWMLPRLRSFETDLKQMADAHKASRERFVADPTQVSEIRRELARFNEALDSVFLIEKQVAQVALQSADRHLEFGHYGVARELITMAKTFLEKRDKAVDGIIEATETTKLREMRDCSQDRLCFLTDTAARMRNALSKGLEGEPQFTGRMAALKKALKQSVEPDYEWLYRPITLRLDAYYRRWAEARRARNYETARENHRWLKEALSTMETRIKQATLLYDFVETYRTRLKDLRLSRLGGDLSELPSAKEAFVAQARAFHQTFAEFAEKQGWKKTGHTAPLYRAWWIKFYQSVFISPRINNEEEGGPRRVDNPTFKAFSRYFEIAVRNDIDQVLDTPFMALKKRTRAFLEEMRAGQGEADRVYRRLFPRFAGDQAALTQDLRDKLENILAEEYGADPQDFEFMHSLWRRPATGWEIAEE